MLVQHLQWQVHTPVTCTTTSSPLHVQYDPTLVDMSISWAERFGLLMETINSTSSTYTQASCTHRFVVRRRKQPIRLQHLKRRWICMHACIRMEANQDSCQHVEAYNVKRQPSSDELALPHQSLTLAQDDRWRYASYMQVE